MVTATFRFILVIGLGLVVTGCGAGFEVPTDQFSDGSEDVKHGPVLDERPDNSNPVLDPEFEVLPSGVKLSEISVRGSKLSLTRGTGTAFTSSLLADYQNLKKATQTEPGHKVQWALMDLTSHRVVAKSLSSNKKLFGASSSKIYVASTFVEKQNAVLSDSQMQLMADMLVVSSNVAWINLQTQIGDGNPDKGRERINDFTKRMGYLNTRGYQG
jgi:hypothetical protein